MQMRGALMRVLRIVVVAVLAWLAFTWLQPKGLGWLVPVVAGVLMVLWIGYRAVRIRRLRQEDRRADRWAEALVSPADRPAAVRELREELGQLDPKDGAQAPKHARLTLVLAELLEADGDPADALAALAKVNDDALGEVLAAVIRHARAVSHLSAGEPEAAAAALDALPGPCGDRGIDMRIRLMRGLIAAERGDAEEALAVAELARDEAGDDADLKLEARVLKAVALDAAANREGALKIMHAIGDEMLEVLAILGLPRVRGLASEALEGRDQSIE
jgi:tetratricopeptide (TPR) repeat protein